MALEDLVGTSKFIDDLVISNPVGSTDTVASLDNHIRGVKNVLKNTFPNVNEAITSTAAELNILDGVNSTATELNYNNIATLGTAQASKAVTVDESKDIIGLNSVTSTSFVGALSGNATTAGTITNQGALATLDSVAAAQIDASAVGQGEIKTTRGSVSTSGSDVNANVVSPGGQYGFWPSVSTSATGLGRTIELHVTKAVDVVDATYIHMITTGAPDAYGIVYQRYITASKPYNLGDGEIGIFIFALIDKASGFIELIYVAEEAPWHYNGPTDIRGKLLADGKKYRTRKNMSNVPFTLAEAKTDLGKLREYTKAFNDANDIYEEITQEIKQSDMGLIPHPFIGNDLTGKTVVMLDPVCDLNHELALTAEQHDEFNINELLHDGHLQISNQGLKRSGPNGILIPSFSWKKTK